MTKKEENKKYVNTKIGRINHRKSVIKYQNSIKGGYNKARSTAKRNYLITYEEFDRLFKSGCEECGFKSDFGLDFHHKDNNRNNNSRDNLVYLCPNCHYSKHRRNINIHNQ